MKRLLTLVALVAVAGSALATETGGFSGRITDRVTGDPIEGAMVIARGENGMGRGRTNARGLYVVRGLQPGVYRARAMARGYEPANYPRPIPVRAGNITEGIDGALQPVQQQRPGAITGRIIDKRTGRPIEGAVVMAFTRGCHKRARTNARGFYEIRGLRPGGYRVKAKARHYMPACFPREVPVRSGQTTENVNFMLVHKPRRGAIVGRVVDARTHRPLAGAVILVRGVNGHGRATTDRRGFYKVTQLDPGRYQVKAMARGYQTATFPRPVGVRPGEVTGRINFMLRRIRTDAD